MIPNSPYNVIVVLESDLNILLDHLPRADVSRGVSQVES
jgi:hypothetical protein